MRIGKKYDIGLIYSQAMLRFTTEFPSTLAAFDNCPTQPNRIDSFTLDPLSVVKLAYETQTLCILPAAWYLCCAEYDLDDIFDGKSAYGDALVTLSTENLRTCVLGREKLLDDRLEFHTWIAEDSKHCYDPLDCITKKRNALYTLAGTPCFAESLTRWNDMNKVLLGDLDLCGVCYKDAEACYERGRQNIWDELPTYFGLPPWEILLKD